MSQDGCKMETNKIIHGDALEKLKELPNNSVDLIIADPPYNIRKDYWDYRADYLEWIKKVFLECQRVLKDNGSFYWFHSEMPVIAELMTWMERETEFIFRQFIVWNKRFKGSRNKGYLDGYVQVSDLRNYQQMAEYIMYYTFQDETGLSKVKGHCVYPSREYIRNEILRANGEINLKEINRVLGTADSGGGVASATLSLDKTHPSFITKEHYEILREWLNNGRGKKHEDLRKEHEYLRKEYEDLRKEYEDLRFTFNNQKTHHSVWNYDLVLETSHPTQKPVPLIKNILKHSSNEGDLILDPFLGSGTTAVACIRLNRTYIGIELNEEYVEIAEKRVKPYLEQERLSEFLGD